MKAVLSVTPIKLGEVKLVARFSSVQLNDIMGDLDTKILKEWEYI